MFLHSFQVWGFFIFSHLITLRFQEVSKVMENIPEKEFKKTFDKLLERMELCISNNGGYFEHLMK